MSKETVEKLETDERSETDENEITTCNWCEKSIEDYKGETFVSNKKRVDICDECMDFVDPQQMNKEKKNEEISPHMFEKSQVETILRETKDEAMITTVVWLAIANFMVVFPIGIAQSLSLALSILLIFIIIHAAITIYCMPKLVVKKFKKNPEKYLRQ